MSADISLYPHDGDREYMERLPESLKSLGIALLNAVRREDDGELQFMPKNGMFVNRPSNHWTVTIRPKKQVLAITIYGTPEMHGEDTEGFTLGKTMSRYSWFEVSVPAQIDAAARLIENARKLKGRL